MNLSREDGSEMVLHCRDDVHCNHEKGECYLSIQCKPVPPPLGLTAAQKMDLLLPLGIIFVFCLMGILTFERKKS